MSPLMQHDAQGIERCRRCAEATQQMLKAERRNIEARILALSDEQVYLESFINVLELQVSRPPTRQVPLPVQVLNMRASLLQALRSQLHLVKLIMKYYARIQMEVVSSGVMAVSGWRYALNHDEHTAMLRDTR